MKLYNTLDRKVETFEPLSGRVVKLYTCGPTVYDYYHIGNLRNAVFNDILRRTLEVLGYDVKHVMNITDVGHLVSDADEGEDKLEKAAEREDKSVLEVAKHYTDAFKTDMQAMNVLPPNGYHSKKYNDSYARATEFIEQQIEIIKALIDKDFAYQTEQAIYFEVSKLPDYGLLSGQRLRDKEVAARQEVVTDPNKRSPYDFAVWFFSVGHFSGHSMHWDSPWGDGFPGWHLECSAIIHSVLGDPIDIHTGGVDHIGTHHPNEMAQTEAAFGHELSKFWIHNEFVLVDGKKMAKSKGNSFTLKDITARKFSPMAYRLLVLQAHYRTELNFSWENLAAAHSRLKDLYAMAALRWQARDGLNDASTVVLKDCPRELVSILANDLDTPSALAYISEIWAQLRDLLIDSRTSNRYNNLDDFTEFIKSIDDLLGLNLMGIKDITPTQKELIAKREEARKNSDWKVSDEIRDKLLDEGIVLRDTPHGSVWSRI